jgi:hypothetical protein
LLGVVVTAASLAILVLLWATWPRPPDTTELTLMESWSAWMALRQGLDRRMSWHTAQYVESVQMHRMHTYVAFAGAAVGPAISLLAFVMRKSRVARRT